MLCFFENRSKVIFFGGLLLLVFTLSGWSIRDLQNLDKLNALQSGEPGLSPEAEQLDSRVDDFSRTVAEGALLGALAGAAVGVAVGDDRESALIGAAIGAGIGGASGYYIAGKKQEFTDQEDALLALKQDFSDANASLSDMLSLAQELLVADTERLESLEMQVAENQKSKQDYESMLAQVQNDRAVIARAIEVADKKYNESLANLENFQEQFGVESEEELYALLDQYKEQKAMLASVDQQMAELL